MSIADVMAIVASLILLGVAFPALLFVLTLTFPQLVERSKEQIETRPIANLFTGAVLFVIAFLAVVILLNIPGPAKLLGAVIFLSILSIAMIGGAGLISQLANKYETISNSQKGVKNLLYSAMFLEFASAVPFVGWFVVMPISFCLMLGAGSKAILQRRAKSQPKTPVQTQESFNNINLYPAN